MGVYKVKGKKGDSWYINISVEGRRIRKRVGTKRDAENALAAIKADILRGEYRFKKDRKIRFEDFAKEYLEYAKTNKKSWKRDELCLKTFVPFFGNMLLSKITPLHIEKYKRMRLDEVKPGTVNRELACLKHMFTIAEKFRKFEDKNPVKEVKFLQERQYVMKILDSEGIKRLVNAATDPLKPILIIALNTGMRKGEILNLKWNDVDFISHYIHIKESKSNIMRKIPMNSVVAAALKGIKRENDFVFPSTKTKEPITDVFQSFKRACREASIKDLRFHDLRHTAATLMITGGIDLVTVSQILGHSDIKMTMRYAHPTPENKRRAVDVLALIFGSGQEEKNGHKTSQTQIVQDVSSLLSGSKN
jgi:integrase